jgi:hypothetical protein
MRGRGRPRAQPTAAAWEGCTEVRQSSDQNRCVLQRVRTRLRCTPQGPSAKLLTRRMVSAHSLLARSDPLQQRPYTVAEATPLFRFRRAADHTLRVGKSGACAGCWQSTNTACLSANLIRNECLDPLMRQALPECSFAVRNQQPRGRGACYGQTRANQGQAPRAAEINSSSGGGELSPSPFLD